MSDVFQTYVFGAAFRSNGLLSLAAAITLFFDVYIKSFSKNCSSSPILSFTTIKIRIGAKRVVDTLMSRSDLNPTNAPLSEEYISVSSIPLRQFPSFKKRNGELMLIMHRSLSGWAYICSYFLYNQVFWPQIAEWSEQCFMKLWQSEQCCDSRSGHWLAWCPSKHIRQSESIW